MQDEWQVGQEVYVTFSRGFGQPRIEAITKIGRKWITLGERDRYRFQKGSRSLEGGEYISPGSVWLNEAEYKEHISRLNAWASLCDKFKRWSLPDHLSLQDIQDIASRIAPPPETETP